MTQEEFKKLVLMSFSDFSTSSLDYYIEEGKKLLSNAVALDTAIIDIIDRLELERAARG